MRACSFLKPIPELNLAGSGVRLTPLPSPPLPGQGVLGELRWVDNGAVSALWVKTTRGWKKSELLWQLVHILVHASINDGMICQR
jgi:hypothetical protein